MAVKLHVVSVGTSILGNLRRRGVEVPGPGQWEDWLRERGSEIFLQALDYLREDPWRMSAELNGMRDFLERGEVDEAYLIATDTEAGRFCSELVKGFLAERGVNVLGESGPILGYYKVRDISGEEQAAERFSEDLHTLFNRLVAFLRKHKRELGKEVYINATGGFKPELAVLSLVGNLFLVPVYYRHETFGVSVFLPPLIPPRLFPEELEFLRRIYESEDRRIRGPEAERLVQEKGQLILRLEAFKVLEREIDEAGKVYGLKLTPQGKFWVEVGKV